MKVTLDYSAGSVVVICPCGWREVTTARGPALTAAAAHLDAIHAAGQAAAALTHRATRLAPR